jgi:proline iminopeptidase
MSSSSSNSKSISSTSNSIRLSSSLSTPATTSKSNVKVSSLADSFQDGTIEVSREYPTDDSDDSSSSESLSSSTHSLHYRIHNRMNLSSQKAAPILVLHGGPGVPSDYLYPLKSVVPYRSIVFYDQLGSGRSPGPDNINAYSIEKSIDDLEYLIKKLSLRRFHLYGQSFGGILAFEYLKRIVERNIGSDGDTDDRDQPECLSVILSSSPTNVEQVENSANTLIENLLSEDDDKTTIAERFRQQNQCRTVDKPQSLIDAYNHAGTIWRGTDVIQEWKATKPMDDAKRMPSAMVMRGEYDFVSQECVDGWKKVFNHPFVRVKVLDGCSHHGLLENGNAYGEIVDSYFAEYD